MPNIERLLRRLLLVTAFAAQPASAGVYDDILAAAEHGHNEVVVKLLQLGMDVNTAAPDGTTLLMMAARSGNLDLLEFLLRNRANHLKKNKYGDTAIKLAAMQNQLEVVRRLTNLGDIGEDEGQWTALQYAAFAGHVEVARLLVAKGAKVNSYAPNRQTPLMLAVARGHLAMVDFLYHSQADFDLRDERGRAALDIARDANQSQVIDYLIRLDHCE